MSVPVLPWRSCTSENSVSRRSVSPTRIGAWKVSFAPAYMRRGGGEIGQMPAGRHRLAARGRLFLALERHRHAAQRRRGRLVLLDDLAAELAAQRVDVYSGSHVVSPHPASFQPCSSAASSRQRSGPPSIWRSKVQRL